MWTKTPKLSLFTTFERAHNNRWFKIFPLKKHKSPSQNLSSISEKSTAPTVVATRMCSSHSTPQHHTYVPRARGTRALRAFHVGGFGAPLAFRWTTGTATYTNLPRISGNVAGCPSDGGRAPGPPDSLRWAQLAGPPEERSRESWQRGQKISNCPDKRVICYDKY